MGFDCGMLATQAIQEVSIPVRNKKIAAGYEFKNFPLIYPHDVIAYLFSELQISISEEEVHRYWIHAASTEQPFAIHSPGDASTIPLGFYVDAAKLSTIYKQEKIVCLWINLPLYRPKSTRSSRWMVFSIMADQLYGHHTMDRVLKHVVWSLQILFHNEVPQWGPFGGPLPANLAGREGEQMIPGPKLSFLVTEYRGDWEWHRDLWQFTTCSWLGKSVCWMCRAERTDDWNNAYWNLEENSFWANAPFSLGEFLLERQPDHGFCH